MHAARTVMPSILCTSPEFQYRNAVNTNVADTFAQARARLAAQQAAEKKSAKPRRQHRPALMTVRRVRAGTTNHLTLPLF